MVHSMFSSFPSLDKLYPLFFQPDDQALNLMPLFPDAFKNASSTCQILS